MSELLHTSTQAHNTPARSYSRASVSCGAAAVPTMPAFRGFLHRVAISSILVLLLLFFLLSSATAFAASYTFVPASGSYEVGETFTVRLLINTAGQSVVGLVGGGALAYDSSKLTLTNISFVDFNLPVTEPTVGPSPIRFEGGKIGSASGNVAVLNATFRGRAEGSATVSIQDAQILQAGSSILTGAAPSATFSITPAAAAPEPPATPSTPTTPQRTVNIPVPNAPAVTSETHADEDAWYAITEVSYEWDIPYGVTALQTAFGEDPTLEPDELHEPPISSWEKGDITDGTWYFAVTFKNRGGWSSTTRFAINVDTTPPEPFEVVSVGGDLTAQVRFEATDGLSGIEVYRISVDGERPRDVQPNELVAGGYTISNLDPGMHTISVTAVDLAGNETMVDATVEVTGTKPVAEDEEAVTTSGFGPIYWVSLLFMAALAVVITILVHERRKHTEERDHIKREAAEAGDKLINIFGVLRDEIEEKVTELSHKPNMTDNERNILESLKDALDISEELIDKEIEDVRKLLK